jgi:hypothetical protein
MMTKGTTGAHHERLQALREEIERKTGKTPEQLYDEREKRVRDTIELKEPDRVPLWVDPDIPKYSGLPRSAAYYEPAAWKEAVINANVDFQPDLCTPAMGIPGLTWEALDVKNRRWPGGPLPPDYEFQVVEGEYMKEEEYDIFLSDPSDFVIRYFLPRAYGALLPLAKLPPLGLMFGGFEGLTALFASPEFEQLAKALSKAGKELLNYRQAMGNLQEDLALLGFPPFAQFGGVGGAPFDTVSSGLRGMKGSMTDMFRRPEKLLQACDMILDRKIAMAAPAGPYKRGSTVRIGIPLWRGDRIFMSDQQFRKFYWPGLKRALLADIELGYIPIPSFEAYFGDRLECLLELPKGKVLAMVHDSDAVRAKEILKGHTCIITGAPLSMKLASVQELEDFYKDRIKVCGKGGGLILMCNLNFSDKAKMKSCKAMIDRLKEYGRY